MAGGLAAPAPIKIIHVAGGTTLFRIALDELGDAEQWDRIASLNGLTDPWLMTFQGPIKIPARLSGSSVSAVNGQQ